jgi:hypothetical protein
MNDKSERISLFRLLSQYVPGGTVEKKENPQSGNPTSQPRFKPSTPNIQAYSNTSTSKHSELDLYQRYKDTRYSRVQWGFLLAETMTLHALTVRYRSRMFRIN